MTSAPHSGFPPRMAPGGGGVPPGRYLESHFEGSRAQKRSDTISEISDPEIQFCRFGNSRRLPEGPGWAIGRRHSKIWCRARKLNSPRRGLPRLPSFDFPGQPSFQMAFASSDLSFQMEPQAMTSLNLRAAGLNCSGGTTI